MKVVVNKCYGGFSLSAEAIDMYLKLCGKEAFFYKQTKHGYKDKVDEFAKVAASERNIDIFCHVVTKDLGPTTNNLNEGYFFDHDISRTDPNLVKVVETLKDKANGMFAELVICEIPDDVKYEIDDYDGMERIHEVHRSW